MNKYSLLRSAMRRVRHFGIMRVDDGGGSETERYVLLDLCYNI